MSVEVATPLVERSTEFLVVVQCRYALAQRITLLDRGKVVIRELALGAYPRAGLRRIQLFHPAVGIGDLSAVIVLHDIAPRGRRVPKRLIGGRRRTQLTRQLRLQRQFGNFNSRSIAWNRGSLRTGSMSGSVFRDANPGSRRRIAVSSH